MYISVHMCMKVSCMTVCSNLCVLVCFVGHIHNVINAIMFIATCDNVTMMFMCHAMYCERCHIHIYALHW